MNFKLNFEDIAIFAKVVSAALLIVGFVLLGYYLGLYFEDRYGLGRSIPLWGALLGAVLGLLQCWNMIKSIADKLKNDRRE
ncbi:MAG: sodium-dependent proline transporter [Acetomicrobium sp.]|jgi:uncharacterized protein YqgC (DUF456 family)|uniref:F0F1-ATPase subunit n=2 Tax=Acetomicrobium TaxID=49894 RepID=A0A0T5XA91_9BACT|nr:MULTISPECIES: hypothetical protein [Acetomicrobium]KRT35277.1 hypothetical protein HMPREF1705_04547 [Acetomicrobium hydrogeniformans ATCC BAA-1850]MBC7321766.1 sodium-dependent proline transporter [Acetomicrobium sp.]SDX92686.1 hypothetical protein SAMN03080603_01166 [Acetomicrobium thermoterrenum DSM 13490]